MPILTLKRWVSFISLLTLVLTGTILFGLLTGTERISLMETIQIIQHGIDTDDPSLGPKAIILFQVRLPRVLMAGLVGAILALCGVVFQILLRNPLADPFILGISSGSALGVYLAMLLDLRIGLLGFAALPISAFGGGLLAVWLVYQIARIDGRLPITGLLLAGVVVNAVFSSLILFISSLLDANRVMNILIWTMGHIGSPDYKTIWVLLIYSLIGGALLFLFAKPLNLLALGEESAKTLGVPVERLKRLLLILVTLLTGAAVSVSGIVGFVGIIAPHAVRMITGSDHRLLLPASALIGAAFLILADTLARTIMGPVEIPVGILTSLCGGPIFLIMLRKKRGYGY